jgi:hypothetical protein
VERFDMIPIANSRQVAATTAGIARKLDLIAEPRAMPGGQGGGNLNGTAATSILYVHAGTSAQRIAVPRQSAGNYCGVV